VAYDLSGNAAVYNYDAVGNLLSIGNYPSTSPSAFTFNSASGSAGSTITIYGTDLCSNPTVTFNGVNATVVSASSTQIEVIVPAGATTGEVVVTCGSNQFNVGTFTIGGGNAPSITSFTPTIGSAGTAVTINGSNFQPAATNNSLSFGNAPAAVTSASGTVLSAAVPSTAITGPISVTTFTGQSVSTGYFFVPPPTFTASSIAVTGTIVIGGQPVNLTLGTAGTEALFAFNGTAGQQVSLYVTNSTFPTADSQMIYLIPPGGNTSNAIGTLGLSSSTGIMPSIHLPTTGTYTVFVVPYGTDTGSMTLQLLGPIVVNGLSIGGSPVTTPVNLPGQTYSAAFRGTAGQQISLSYTNLTSCNTFYAIPPLGTISNAIASSSVCGPGTGFLPVILPSTDIYTIFIEPEGGSTGSMTLQLLQDQTGTLTLNGPAVPVSTILNQIADLSFTGTANQQVSLSVSNSTYGETASNPYQPLGTSIQVLNSAGSNLNSFSFPLGGGDSGAFSLPSTPSSGTYIVQFAEGAAGSANVALYDATPVTGNITVNGSAVGLNTNPGQPLELSVSGTQQGQQLLVGISSSTYGSVSYTVFEPGGTSIASGWIDGPSGSNSIPPLPSGGAYTLELIGDLGAGSASVQLSTTTAQNLTTTIGSALTVTLNGQPVSITFHGNEGQWVEIVGSDLSLTGCVQVQLLSPSGTFMTGAACLGFENYVNYSFNPPETIYYFFDAVELPTTGTYTIYLENDNGVTGSVEVDLYDATPTTAPITLNGPPVTAFMSTPSQNFMYTFTGTPGERTGVAITNYDYITCYTQTINLYEPNGDLLDQVELYFAVSGEIIPPFYYPGGTATMTDVLPSNGTYELYVDDSSCLEGTSQIQLYNSPMLTGTIGINGPTVTALSTVPGQETQLTFTGSQNESISLQTSNSTYLACWPYYAFFGGGAVLTDPNGHYIDEAGFCEEPSFGPDTLSASGTYTITVEPVSAPGSVDLTLTSP